MIAPTKTTAVRCAIYTRVSTADQAEGDFCSLDNQRESAEAYIRSPEEQRLASPPHSLRRRRVLGRDGGAPSPDQAPGGRGEGTHRHRRGLQGRSAQPLAAWTSDG